MTQKTFKLNLDCCLDDQPKGFKVGDEYTLVCFEDERTGKERFSLFLGGIPGNKNLEILRFHGWRGTTEGVARYALGVRRIIKASEVKIDNEGMYYQKITVGKDLHPDWE